MYEYDRVLKYPDKHDLIITLGRNGARYNEKLFPPYHVGIDNTGHRDVCGAGDTFLSGLVKMYLDKNNMEKAIAFANCCSAIVVNKFGVIPITEEEAMNNYE